MISEGYVTLMMLRFDLCICVIISSLLLACHMVLISAMSFACSCFGFVLLITLLYMGWWLYDLGRWMEDK